MKIKSISTRQDWVLVTLEKGRDPVYRLPRRDLWELGMALEGVFADNGIAAVVPVTLAPELVENFRDRVKAAEFYVQDSAESENIMDRRRRGQHVAGGKWYAEITVADIATDCSFSTLEELYVTVYQIIYRECTLMVGQQRYISGRANRTQ